MADKPGKVQVSFQIPPETREVLARASRIEGLSAGALVELAVREYLANHYGPDPLQGMAARAAEQFSQPLSVEMGFAA